MSRRATSRRRIEATETADLSDYIFFVNGAFKAELRLTDRTLSPALPGSCLEQVGSEAPRPGMPHQRLMLLAIERALAFAIGAVSHCVVEVGQAILLRHG